MSISKVALRRKPLSNGKKESLVLEFTPPILDKDTLCRVHKKHLGIYIWAKPKTEEERDYNDEMLEYIMSIDFENMNEKLIGKIVDSCQAYQNYLTVKNKKLAEFLTWLESCRENN